MGRADGLGTRQLQVQRFQELAQVLQSVDRRAVVDPEHAGPLDRGQHLGGRDIGQDHEFFDQSVAVIARHYLDPVDLAVVVQPDAPLGHVDFQRAAFAPGGVQHPPGGVKRVRGRRSINVARWCRPCVPSAAAWVCE